MGPGLASRSKVRKEKAQTDLSYGPSLGRSSGGERRSPDSDLVRALVARVSLSGPRAHLVSSRVLPEEDDDAIAIACKNHVAMKALGVTLIRLTSLDVLMDRKSSFSK